MRNYFKIGFFSSLVALSGVTISYAERNSLPQQCQENPASGCLDNILNSLRLKIEAEPNISTRQEYLSGIAVTLITARRLEQAEQFTRDIQSENLRDQNLGSIASDYAEKGNLEDAQRVLESIKSPIIRGIVEVAILSADFNADSIDESLKRIAKIENLPLRESGRSEIAKDLALSGDYERAKEIADGMSEGGLRNHLFGWIALKQLDAISVEEAMVTLKSMTPVDQRMIAQSHLAKKLSDKGNETASTRLFEQTRKMLTQHDLDAERFMVVQEKLAMDNSDVGRQEIALEIALGITDPARKIGVFSHVADNYARKNDETAAVSLYTQSVREAQKVTPEPRKANILNMLSRRLALQGAAVEAAAIADTVKDPHSRALAMQEIGFTLLRQGDLVKAEQIFRKISDPDFKDHSLLHLAARLQEAGRTTEAIGTLDAVIDNISRRPGSPLLDIVYPPMAIVQLKTGRLEEATSSLMRISERDMRIENMLAVAKSAVEMGQVEFAGSLGEKALEETKHLESDDQKVRWLSKIILSEAAKIGADKIRTLVGLIEDDQQRNKLITALGFGLLDQGERIKARTLVGELGDRDTKDQFELVMLSWLLNDALKH
ncbi:MAG: hypothetical protein ABJN26_19745 [Stappiaceae bacterium]